METKRLKIIILRHGESRQPAWVWRLIKAVELGDWIDAYNRAGIRQTAPAMRAVNAARECKVIVTSDLTRSVESAKALASETPVISESLFREAGLPFRPMGNVKLPLVAWALFFRFLWSLGFETNGEPIHSFKERSREATDRLIGLAQEHGSVLFVGHGIINSYIARHLLSDGWTGPRGPRTHYWACTEYALDN